MPTADGARSVGSDRSGVFVARSYDPQLSA
jgi:hypothetical protein